MPISNESSLHAALKKWCFEEGDLLEQPVDGYVIDIVRGSTLIEIQTGNFSKIKPKLNELLPSHKIHLVHPIPHQKLITKYKSVNSTIFTRRKSPKKGRLDHLFNELVYIPDLLINENFTLEILMTQEEEIRINDGKGSWRRNGWSILDRNLLEVVESIMISSPDQLLAYFKNDLAGQVITKEFATRRNISERLARKIFYCLVKMNLLTAIGKKGKAKLYTLT